ncbi:MAG TPA: DNA polymerase III subunit delta [Lichenihabitans sp.]|jgi:DNA polymerase-3 subunit delta|nr:DNA polymerase III subunit delta [Lichenihabitans sp.]
MVAIKSSEAERLLTRDVASYSAFLVYGSDVGLVSERVRRLVKALVDDPGDPFQLVRLGADDVAREPTRLLDEAQTVPLFGGRRAILADGGARTMAAAVERYLEASSPCPLVIEAGALKPDAPLRKLVERARKAAAIACYPDGERELAGLIDAEVAAAGLAIEADAKALLASLLGADRLASRSEIEKLILYAHGGGTIRVADVEAAVADASAQGMDDAVDAAFGGDTAALDAAASRLHLGPVEAGLLLGAALRHAVMLHKAKLSGEGAPFRGGLSPRRKAAVERQLADFGAEALARMVVRLGETIGQLRRDPRLAPDHAVRTLWAVAQASRPRRR